MLGRRLRRYESYWPIDTRRARPPRRLCRAAAGGREHRRRPVRTDRLRLGDRIGERRAEFGVGEDDEEARGDDCVDPGDDPLGGVPVGGDPDDVSVDGDETRD